MRSSVFGTSIFYAAEPSCFDLAAGSDQIEQYWHTFFGHAEVVDHNLRQLRQAIKVRRQGCGIDIKLSVPAADCVTARCQRDIVDTPALDVETNRTHANLAELSDLRGRIVVRNLCHADPTGAELAERVDHISLVVRLERARYHRACNHSKQFRLFQILRKGEAGGV